MRDSSESEKMAIFGLVESEYRRDAGIGGGIVGSGEGMPSCISYRSAWVLRGMGRRGALGGGYNTQQLPCCSQVALPTSLTLAQWGLPPNFFIMVS
jgi:hypothetical protein